MSSPNTLSFLPGNFHGTLPGLKPELNQRSPCIIKGIVDSRVSTSWLNRTTTSFVYLPWEIRYSRCGRFYLNGCERSYRQCLGPYSMWPPWNELFVEFFLRSRSIALNRVKCPCVPEKLNCLVHTILWSQWMRQFAQRVYCLLLVFIGGGEFSQT